MLFQGKLSMMIVALVSIAAFEYHPNSALPTLFCARSYMNLFKERVINRTKFMQSVNLASAKVDEQYAQALSSGSLDNLDELEKSSYYQKLLIEQLRQMRQSYETKPNNKLAPIINKVDKHPDDQLIESCLAISKVAGKTDENESNGAEWQHGVWDPDAIIDAESEEEIKLLNELDTLEQIAKNEAAMGWSLSEETKNQLRYRTNAVIRDLLSNELRQLAMAMLSAYISGGTVTAVFAAISGPLQHKIVEFILNSVVDIVSSIMGRRVEIRSADEEMAHLEKKVSRRKKSNKDIQADWEVVDTPEVVTSPSSAKQVDVKIEDEK